MSEIKTLKYTSSLLPVYGAIKEEAETMVQVKINIYY